MMYKEYENFSVWVEGYGEDVKVLGLPEYKWYHKEDTFYIARGQGFNTNVGYTIIWPIEDGESEPEIREDFWEDYRIYKDGDFGL